MDHCFAGFPNMTAIALEDPTGKTYVHLMDFIRVGLPASVVAWVVVVTLGYALMCAVGY
jgi:phosphate transporter